MKKMVCVRLLCLVGLQGCWLGEGKPLQSDDIEQGSAQESAVEQKNEQRRLNWVKLSNMHRATLGASSDKDWVLALGMGNTGENAQRLEGLDRVLIWESNRDLLDPNGPPFFSQDFNETVWWWSLARAGIGKFQCITFDDSTIKSFSVHDPLCIIKCMALMLYTGGRLVLPLEGAMHTGQPIPSADQLSAASQLKAEAEEQHFNFNASGWCPAALVNDEVLRHQWANYLGKNRREYIIQVLQDTGLFASVEVQKGAEQRPFAPHPVYGDGADSEYIVATRGEKSLSYQDCLPNRGG